MEPSKPSAVERVTGSLPVQIGAAAIAAVGGEAAASSLGVTFGQVVVAMLPALANSLAFDRYVKRVDAQLREIDNRLQKLEADALSDTRCEIIRSVVIAIQIGADGEKFEYLKRAVHNLTHMSDLPSQYTVHIGRVLRDMSAQEARFIAMNFAYSWIMATSNKSAADAQTLIVEPGSEDDAILAGLQQLGLLLPAGEVLDTIGKFRYSPVVAKLLARLFEPMAPAAT